MDLQLANIVNLLIEPFGNNLFWISLFHSVLFDGHGSGSSLFELGLLWSFSSNSAFLI